MKSYFEIGGTVIELSFHSTHSPLTSVPSGVSQIAQQPDRAARNGQAKRSRAASPRTRTHAPYSGVGHPLVWLGASMLLKGVHALHGVVEPQELAY